MSSQYVYWISLDPVNRKIDPYPRFISQKLETMYNNRDIYVTSSCTLGSDFFNATVHFHYSGYLYQTTQGFSMGRHGFKKPGYRNVQRIVIDENQENIIVYGKFVNGEMRITTNINKMEFTFNESIQKQHLLKNEGEIINYNIDYWKPEDLNSNESTKNVIIWEWCRGTRERNGDLIKLSNDWWIPYLFCYNEKIEQTFANKEEETTIILPNESIERIIKFIPNTSYGYQIREENNCKYIRMIRRRIISIAELKEKLENMNNLPATIDHNILESFIDSDEIPNEFYCSISQAIMIDPVKTVDGHTYDRSSIERWFQINTTSPLTGLRLTSLTLVPNLILKEQIEKFILEKTQRQNNQQTTQLQNT